MHSCIANNIIYSIVFCASKRYHVFRLSFPLSSWKRQRQHKQDRRMAKKWIHVIYDDYRQITKPSKKRIIFYGRWIQNYTIAHTHTYARTHQTRQAMSSGLRQGHTCTQLTPRYTTHRCATVHRLYWTVGKAWNCYHWIWYRKSNMVSWFKGMHLQQFSTVYSLWKMAEIYQRKKILAKCENEIRVKCPLLYEPIDSRRGLTASNTNCLGDLGLFRGEWWSYGVYCGLFGS